MENLTYLNWWKKKLGLQISTSLLFYACLSSQTKHSSLFIFDFSLSALVCLSSPCSSLYFLLFLCKVHILWFPIDPKKEKDIVIPGLWFPMIWFPENKKNINWSRIFILLRYIQLVFLGPKQWQVLEPKVHYFCFPTLETKHIAYF